MDRRLQTEFQGPDFDALLEESLPEQPPEEVVWEVTPWRRAMRRILIGTALQTITFQLWGLSYLLPVLGQILLLLGYRALRRENGWFRFSWAAVLLRSVVLASVWCVHATIYSNCITAAPAFSLWLGLGRLLQLSLFFALWGGLRAVGRKAGVQVRARSALALVALFALLGLLARLGCSGWKLALILLAVYGAILWNLRKIAGVLDEAGYCVTPCPVLLSDRALAGLLAGAMALLLAGGYLFAAQYPMDWSARPSEASATQEALRSRLLDLGFPADVLSDLSKEDLLACDEAVRVVTSSESCRVENAVDAPPVVQFTCVAVELAGEATRWRIIHHFRWLVEPGCHGTEALRLLNPEQADAGWDCGANVSGQLLCERDGVTYLAPYWSLEWDDYQIQSFLHGTVTIRPVLAAFSLPDWGEHPRGYLAYTAAEQWEDMVLRSQFNYMHQASWLQYPVKTALEQLRSEESVLHTPFQKFQHVFRFDPYKADKTAP